MKAGINKNKLVKFAPALLKWHWSKNDRQMPWKGEKDPYKIWLSEIILQQTRVEQGLNYYKSFVIAFPDVHKLANAEDGKVFKLWEGLGYYSRCKNLLLTARHISKKRKGRFPDTYEEIIKLKGIGPYTAAAISSFAFNLPYAVVDGNVFRVLARVFGIEKATDTTGGKNLFTNLANELLDKQQPGVYNQALMDFGAVICKPQNPDCNNCVLRNHCSAFKNDLVNELPVKEKKIKISTRWFNYLVIEFRGKVYIHKRTANDIWKNLHEFVLIETRSNASVNKILVKAEKDDILKKDSYQLLSVSPLSFQQLSHQKIQGRFIKISLKKDIGLPGFKPVSSKQLLTHAFPGFINAYFGRVGY